MKSKGNFNNIFLLLLAVYTAFVAKHYFDFHDNSEFGLHSRCDAINISNPLHNITAWKSIMLNTTTCLETVSACPQLAPLCSRPDTYAQAMLSGVNFKALILNSPKNYITPYHHAATDTVACLVSGRKKWYFWNRHLSQYYDKDLEHMGVMFTYKHFHSDHVMMQEPGDCFFFKPFTFHKVISYEESILLTTHHSDNLWNAARQVYDKMVLAM